MQERYLHLLWQLKRLPFHRIKLVDGKEFKLISQGSYNKSESGPDFSNGCIEIEGLKWYGPIELHVKSSDWYRHNHHNDRAYDNVILHVVYENDVKVIQNHHEIPTIELKYFIEEGHFHRYLKLTSSKIDFPCASSLIEIDPVFHRNELEKAVVRKLESNVQLINRLSCRDDLNVLFWLMARAFGCKTNSLPFEELALRVPIEELNDWNYEDKYELIQSVSGLEELNKFSDIISVEKKLKLLTKMNTGIVNRSSWKFKGIRPGSFPNKRVPQFANLIASIDIEHLSWFYTQKDTLAYLKLFFDQYNDRIKKQHLKLSKNLIDQLLINCFVPFLFWKGISLDRSEIREKAFEILDEIQAESNSLVSQWRKRGLSINSALESQGAIELERNRCLKKKCLSCSIGIKVLKG